MQHQPDACASDLADGSHVTCIFKLVKMLSLCADVCRDVNQGGTNRNRCTQTLVILQTY